jgi:hypothetical protein
MSQFRGNFDKKEKRHGLLRPQTLCFPIGFHFLAYPNLFGIKGFVVVVVASSDWGRYNQRRPQRKIQKKKKKKLGSSQHIASPAGVVVATDVPRLGNYC